MTSTTTDNEPRVLFGRSATSIKSRAVRWLWQPYLLDAKVNELGGEPDRAKSIVLIEITAHVSKGEPWFDWTECPRGHVILISSEDDFDDTIVPRLRAARADLDNITLMSTHIEIVEKDGKARRVRFTLPRYLHVLKNAIKSKSAKLVIIDALVSFLDHGTNTNSDGAAREVIDALKELAGETGCAIVVLRHLNKAVGAIGNPLNRMSGSGSFSAAARASLLLDFDPSDNNPNEAERRRVLLKMKNNHSAEADGLVFKLDVVPVLCDSGELVRVPCVEWLGATKLSAAQLMLQQQRRAHGEKPEDERKRTAEAIEFLRMCLADGPRPGQTVRDDALALGLSDRTLTRARQKLGIKPEKPKGKKDAPWIWALPATDTAQRNGTAKPPGVKMANPLKTE